MPKIAPLFPGTQNHNELFSLSPFRRHRWSFRMKCTKNNECKIEAVVGKRTNMGYVSRTQDKGGEWGWWGHSDASECTPRRGMLVTWEV